MHYCAIIRLSIFSQILALDTPPPAPSVTGELWAAF